MKRVLILLSLLFCNVLYADTINLNWLNEDGTIYQNSTCTVDGDLIVPTTPPTKYGHTFTGWKLANYTPLEYIESTGTQYIDTSLTTNNGDISVQAVYEPAGFPVSGDYAAIFGVDTYFQAGYDSAGHANVGNAISTGVFFALNTKATINAVLSTVSSRGTYFVNGADTGLTRQLATSKAVWLFAANFNSAPSQYARGKMYKFVAIRNNTTIMNLIPAKRNSDNVLGMYDLVSGQFFTNAGTGGFIAGPVLQ